MVKPTLNVLEACSRLALSKGQKEDGSSASAFSLAISDSTRESRIKHHLGNSMA